MTTVTVIIPLKGRAEETARLVPRLIATAGHPAEWIAVIDDDPAVAAALRPVAPPELTIVERPERGGYWRACQQATRASSGELLIALANDLLPCRRWLWAGMVAYARAFGEGGDGVLGVNDGIHFGEHAGHFLISRRYLESMGGWPTWYQHGYGDVEIVERAKQQGRFAIGPFFRLYHDHWANGRPRDPIYSLAISSDPQDQATYERRRRLGWPEERAA